VAGANDDLTGVWDGEYSYPRGLKPTPFTAVILDLGGSISGSIHETPPDGPGAGRQRSALLEGTRGGRQVAFVKTYEHAKGSIRNPVRYEGRLDAEGLQITGAWSIPGNWSGRFVMRRPERAAEKAEERRAALVPADWSLSSSSRLASG